MKSLKITLTLFTSVLLVLLSACGNKESISLAQFCWEQASDYTVTESPADPTNSAAAPTSGSVTVTLTAPDYSSLMAGLAENNPSEEITSDTLAKAIKNEPDSVKEYTFTASSSDEDIIREAFLDNIAHDLSVEAVSLCLPDSISDTTVTDTSLAEENNYEYMSLADKLAANEVSASLIRSTDTLINSGTAPAKEDYTKVLADLMVSYEINRESSRTSTGKEAVSQAYTELDTFLAFIDEHADGDLKTTASDLRTQMKRLLELRLNAYDDPENSSLASADEYFLSYDFIFSLMETEEFSNDAEFNSFVFYTLLGITNANYADTFVKSESDQRGLPSVYIHQPGKDFIKHVQELTAFYDISRILQSQWTDIASDAFYSEFLIICRTHGEYCLYSISTEDEKLLSWLDVRDMEGARSWYSQKYDKIMEMKAELKKNQPSDIDYDNLVTEAYSKTVQSGGSSLSFRIPEINLDSPEVEAINNTIYSTMVPYAEEAETKDSYALTCSEISYTWAAYDNILSLVIQSEMYPNATPRTLYDIYNIDITTGTQLNKEELLQIYGMSSDEYFETARTALGSFWWDIYGEFVHQGAFDNIIDFAQEQLSATISDNNVNSLLPFINESGDLCVAGDIYSMAGASKYAHVINLNTFVLSPYYSETVSGSNQSAAPETATPETTAQQNAIISEEEAMAIAESYWDFHKGDIAEETGYLLDVQMQASPPSSDEYLFALRWCVDNTHWSTIDSIYINPTTGECRSAY